jgi:hypothetical protein
MVIIAEVPALAENRRHPWSRHEDYRTGRLGLTSEVCPVVAIGLNTASAGRSCRLVQQRLRLLQIPGVEAFGEPIVNRDKQLIRVLASALAPPQPCEAGRGAQLPGFRLLAPGPIIAGFRSSLRFRREVASATRSPPSSRCPRTTGGIRLQTRRLRFG